MSANASEEDLKLPSDLKQLGDQLTADAKVLERVVAAAFNQRRKMLRASLKGIASDIEDRLIAAGIKPTDRAEQIPLEGFCALAREVAKK